VFPECKNRAECNGAFFCTLLSFLEYAVQKTAEASVFCTPDLCGAKNRCALFLHSGFMGKTRGQKKIKDFVPNLSFLQSYIVKREREEANLNFYEKNCHERLIFFIL